MINDFGKTPWLELDFYNRWRCIGCTSPEARRRLERLVWLRSMALVRLERTNRPLWCVTNHRNVARKIFSFVGVDQLSALDVQVTHGPTSTHADGDCSASGLVAPKSEEVWLTARLACRKIASFTCEVIRRTIDECRPASLAAFYLATVCPSPSFAYECRIQELVWPSGSRLPKVGRTIAPWGSYGTFTWRGDASDGGMYDPRAYEAERIDVEVAGLSASFKVSVRHQNKAAAGDFAGLAIFRAEGGVLAQGRLRLK